LRALAARGDECILVEDTPRNLDAARELGIRTILLLHPQAPRAPDAAPTSAECPAAANLCIDDIAQVNAAIATVAAASN